MGVFVDQGTHRNNEPTSPPNPPLETLFNFTLPSCAPNNISRVLSEAPGEMLDFAQNTAVENADAQKLKNNNRPQGIAYRPAI